MKHIHYARTHGQLSPRSPLLLCHLPAEPEELHCWLVLLHLPYHLSSSDFGLTLGLGPSRASQAAQCSTTAHSPAGVRGPQLLSQLEGTSCISPLAMIQPSSPDMTKLLVMSSSHPVQRSHNQFLKHPTFPVKRSISQLALLLQETFSVCSTPLSSPVIAAKVYG